MNPEADKVRLYGFEPGGNRFRREVLNSLRKSPKELPPKYLYDERGSHLFQHICALHEYYIPHLERAIMEAHLVEMVEFLGPRVSLIEYGSGDCAKTRILLDHLDDPIAYIPIDISREQLLKVTTELASNYPGLEVLPVCADYTSGFELPAPRRSSQRKVVYFPGSTIGNFDPATAKGFLEQVAAMCSPGDGLLIGVDLKKTPSVLHRAYNDDSGVTAAFNLNLLQRINRELNCDFRLKWFEHYAFYNPKEGRVEMHLINLRDQVVHLDSETIHFAKGENIWTESSYKFILEDFQRMAADAGFKVEHVWTDEQQWFSVQYLVGTGQTA